MRQHRPPADFSLPVDDEVVFWLVKGLNKMMAIGKKKEEAAPPAPPEPSAEEKLLTEIRDLLKNK